MHKLTAVHRTASIVLLAASLVAVPVAAAGAEGEMMFIHGVGSASCEAWVQEREDAGRGDAINTGSQAGFIRVERESWVLGFLTAMNLRLPTDRGAARDLAAGVDNAGLFSRIDNYCTANPLLSLMNATIELGNELATKWYAAHPPQ